MTSNQENVNDSNSKYENGAFQGDDVGEYLTAVPTKKFIEHPSPPEQKSPDPDSAIELQAQNQANERENQRYVDSSRAPGSSVLRHSKDGYSEYHELDESLVMNPGRPLPDPKSELKTRQVAEDTRQGSSPARHGTNKRIVCILAIIIVILIVIIVVVGGYAGWKLSQVADTSQCLSPARQQSVCVCETNRCSSACSQDTCSSCCSTAAGAAISSVSFDGRTIQAPVTSDNWLVFMRRESGYVDFISPNWQKYKDGFGNLKGEFWLGNEAMHKLTTNGSQWRLRVDMKAYSGECRYAVYDNFWIGPESQFYQLHISHYSGNAGDSLTATGESWYNHDGVYFSTYDADHDNANDTNCALKWLGGWWYNDCFYAKFTGIYGQNTGLYTGVAWEVWLGEATFLEYADMKISVV